MTRRQLEVIGLLAHAWRLVAWSLLSIVVSILTYGGIVRQHWAVGSREEQPQ